LPLTSVGGQDMFTIKLLDIAQPPQRDDLSMRQGNGTVYVARSTGTAFVNEVWTRWSNVAWQDIRDGDFNGDGLADLSIRHPTSDIRHPTSDRRRLCLPLDRYWFCQSKMGRRGKWLVDRYSRWRF
jgi:hypothetical protein